MKKTFISMLIVISIFILVGCNKQLTTNDNGKVTSEELVNTIEKVHKDSNIYFEKDNYRLSTIFKCSFK